MALLLMKLSNVLVKFINQINDEDVLNSVCFVNRKMCIFVEVVLDRKSRICVILLLEHRI